MSVTESPTSIPPDPLLEAHCPTGPIERRWDQHKFDMKLVNPGNKRKFEIIVVGTGLAGASAAASMAAARLQGQGLHVPRLAPAGALDRRAGRHQRGEELPERRRQHLPAVLRHGEGRRLPRPRVERLPARPGERRHHRPVRGPGRALRPRVRRPARQPLVRRRPGEPHVLRPRPDRPAAPARRLPGPRAAGRAGQRPPVHQDRDARRRGEGRRGRRHRRARPGHRRDQLALGPRRGAGHRRLQQRLLPVDQRHELQHHGHLAGAQEGRAVRQPVLHADPPDLHPEQRRVPVEAHAHVRVAAQRRPHLGAEGSGRHPLAGPDPRRRPRLLPRAQVPGLRQPGPPRRRVAQRQGDGRHRLRRRAAQEPRLPRLRRRHRAGWARTSSASATATSSTCTSASPTRTRTRCRCASTPPSTTRWAGCGSTTT